MTWNQEGESDIVRNHSIGETEQFYFPQNHIARFESLGERFELPKNHVLHRAGETPDACYYIKKGRVVSYEYTVSGGEHIFSVNEAGSMILVPSMVITHELTLSFRTAVPCVLYRIDRTTLQKIICEDAEITEDFMYMLSQRLISTIEQFRERGNYSVSWRVCQMLLSIANRYGQEEDGKIILQEKISQQDMANQLQANRVTVARAIRELKDLQLVEYTGGFYCIKNKEKLQEHMARITE